jgi:LPXTG-motif cell wall-anchored protein
VTTKSEFDRFYDNVAAVSTESEMFMWAFSESYINIRANISSSLKDGNITEEQANKLFNQVDAARTRAELDAVGKELDELLKGTRDSTTTTTKETTTSESKKSDGKGTLPKTGESNQTIFTLLGSFLVTGTAISYILFRKK